MKNERTDKERAGFPAKVETTMATFPAISGVRQRTEPPAGRKTGQPGQETLCTAGNAADGFLKHQFLPLYLESYDLPLDNGITEGVLKSLCILADYHQIELMDVSDKQYPYNVLLAHWNAQKLLGRTRQNPELFIISDDANRISVATRQTVQRSYSLYYIPVLPLYRLLKSREHRIAAKLLLSVFSYLYHVARVPYYRDADTYLFYHYEIMEEWLDEEDGSADEEDLAFKRNALQQASHGGDVIGRIIYKRLHLDQFEERLKGAVPTDGFEAGCLAVAKTAFKLWQDFPDSNLFCHLNDPEREDEDEEDWTGYDNTIRVDEYIHFVADTESSLYDSIQQNVDSELNEKMHWQEHTLVSVYDDNFIPNADTLEYETRLFKLLDELCYLLNELP